jgi:hypothetical protein
LALAALVASLAHAACGGARAPAPWLERTTATRAAPATSWSFAISWRGRAIGVADVRIERRADVVTVRRHEHLRFARGVVDVDEDVELTVEATATLRARRATWTRRGEPTSTQVATWHADGWRVDDRVVAPADAVPSELVPALVQRDGSFAGPVLLLGAALVLAEARVEALGPGRQLALTTVDGVTRRTVVELDEAGWPVTIVDDSGVTAQRVTRTPALPAVRADVLALGALVVRGTPGPEPRIELDGAGPRPRLRDDVPVPPRARALVSEVAAAITPSLARAGDAASAGDCTTYAVELAARLRSAGLDAHLVTGFVLADGRLWPHRWVAIPVGDAWLGLDASRDLAPTGADHVALRVHGLDEAARWAASAALATVASARFVDDAHALAR